MRTERKARPVLSVSLICGNLSCNEDVQPLAFGLILERVCCARYFNFTNQIDVYSPTIEGFGVGIHASYGDTTHIYNAYLGNDNGVLCNCSDVGIRIAEDM